MEVLEEEREDGRSKLNYTHMIRPGVTQLENYGRFLLTIIHFSVSILVFPLYGPPVHMPFPQKENTARKSNLFRGAH